MYRRDNKYYLTQWDLKKAYNEVVEYIQLEQEQGVKFHLVGIARGSFNLIQELSNRCNLEYTILQFSHIDKSDKDIKEGFSSAEVAPGERLLIVDDIADSGLTIHKTIDYLNSCFSWEPQIEVFTIVGNSVKFAEFDWIYSIDHNELDLGWVVFPYENNDYKEVCSECKSAEQCNKYEDLIHCNSFNKSFPKWHSCLEFK